MNCKHVNDLLSQYAEHDLPARVHARIQSHLDGNAGRKPCAACAARLTMLQRVLPLLQPDAQSDPETTPDLYAAFRQRLVTQPARKGPFAFLPSWFAGLPRLGVVALGVCAIAGGRYYRQHRYDPTLNFAINTMRRPVDNVHFVQDTDSVQPNGSVSSDAVEYWIQNGYTWSKQTYQNGPRLPSQAPTPSDFSYSFQYTLPCGVEFMWYQQPARQHNVVLSWTPALPEHPANNIVWYVVLEARAYLQRLKDTGDVQTASIHAKRGIGFLQDCLELDVDHYRRAVPHDPAILSDNPPETLSLWLDKQNRLQRYQEKVVYKDGTHTAHDFRYVYGQHIPFGVYNRSLDMPVLPAHTKVVAIDTVNNRNKYRAIDPVWLTMTASDKQQVQDAITRWAQAWVSGDPTRLRSVVDVKWPLEISRADRRAGLTTEDVWQRIWVDRMAKEPRGQTFVPRTVFAYQAQRWDVERSVADFTTRSSDRPLPGLNALCWIRSVQPDGPVSDFPARLFLVKRQDGYKVFQFCRLMPPRTNESDDEP